MNITSTSLTDSQIATIEQEAAQAGDDATVRTCRRALAGSRRARQLVARILRTAASEQEVSLGR